MEDNWTLKTLMVLLSLILPYVTSCSKVRNETAIRNAISRYLTAAQKSDIDVLYQFELPEFKKRFPLEEYKTHNLLGLDDSTSAFTHTIKNIRYQKDTAIILAEIHFLGTDSIVTDSFKAIFVKGVWYIPTYSSDLYH